MFWAYFLRLRPCLFHLFSLTNNTRKKFPTTCRHEPIPSICWHKTNAVTISNSKHVARGLSICVRNNLNAQFRVKVTKLNDCNVVKYGKSIFLNPGRSLLQA